LIEAEPQKVAGVRVKRRSAKLRDPEIEQPEVAQRAIEKLESECAVGRAQRTGGKLSAMILIGNSAPLRQPPEHGQGKVATGFFHEAAPAVIGARQLKAGLTPGLPIEV